MNNGWDLINHLGDDRKLYLINFYNQSGFSPQFRVLLQSWIERNITLSEKMKQNAEEDKARINILHTRFLEELQNLRNNGSQTDSVRKQSEEALVTFKAMGPEQWYEKISLCLNEEMAEISAENGEQGQDQLGPFDFRIFCFSTYVKLIGVELKTVSVDIHGVIVLNSRFRLLRQAEERLRSDIEMLQKLGRDLPQHHLKLDKVRAELQKREVEVNNRSRTCAGLIKTLTTQVETLKEKVENFMIPVKWSSYGFCEQMPNLDQVEHWYKILMKTVSDIRGAISQLFGQLQDEDTLNIYLNVQTILDRVGTCYMALLTHALAVETQPPPVILKARRLHREQSVSVRFLYRLQYQSHPVVKATIISESQARSLWPVGYLGNEIPSSGTIVSPMGMDRNNGIYKFSSMTVSSVQQRPSEDKEAIQQQALNSKFCLLFHTELYGFGKMVKAWCCSQPVVLAVHGKQVKKATAIAFWDCFHSNGRIPFQIQDQVSWTVMSPALNKLFQLLSNTNRTLSLTNVEYLGQKLLGVPKDQLNDQFMVSAASLLNFVSERTFWNWLYEAADLVKMDSLKLRQPWNNGHIVGFINKTEAEQILRRMNESGAFLVRFSDSIAGTISVAYLFRDGRVSHVVPFNKHDLLKLSMAERLDDEMQYTQVCYENTGEPGRFDLIPRTSVFNKEENQRPIPKGYVEPRVFMTITPNPLKTENAGDANNGNEPADLLQDGIDELLEEIYGSDDSLGSLGGISV